MIKGNITWIGQGGYIIEYANKSICIDPYLSNSVKNLEDFNRIVPIPIRPEDLDVDIIISTHDHRDHLDDETIKYTDWDNILYAGPDECVRHFRKIGISDKNIITINRGDEIKLSDNISIRATYAKHTEGSIGIILKLDDKVIYFTGDSLYDEKMIAVGKYNPQVLFCCINGKLGNMGYKDAAKLAQQLNVKVAIPSHYGMFKENTEDPNRFKKELEQYNINYKELEINEPIYLSKIF